jgi:hypothetical protein
MLPVPAKSLPADATVTTPVPLALLPGGIGIPRLEPVAARPTSSCLHLIYCTWLC